MKSTHGMLFVATNIAPEDEADFNQWYDQEHVEERVAISGFLSGTRYQAVDAERKYLGLYETDSLEAFTSADYHASFARQTEWSVKNLQKMVNPMRRVCAVSHKQGKGSGNYLAVLTLNETADIGILPAWQEKIHQTPGYIASYLLTPDTALSSPLPRETNENRAMRPMLIISSSDPACCEQLARAAAAMLSAEIQLYSLGWQLTKQELTNG